MKKTNLILIVFVLFLTAFNANAQNTYPWSQIGSIGIGTQNPTGTLHVNSNNSNADVKVSLNKDNSQPEAWIQMAMARNFGNYSSLSKPMDAVIRAAGANFLLTNVGPGSTIFATGGFGNETERMVITPEGNIGIGTTRPEDKLEVNGRIHAKAVKVDLQNWPDYVFTPEYQLTPLSEVEKFIQINGHLENIPNANTMIKQGLDLGEMEVLLMEKIEELTLHLIEKDKEIKKLDQEKTELSEKVDQLAIAFTKLEKKINN